jgi:ankyrin repeat protein
LNALNKQEQTPLFLAVAFGNLKAVKFAIKAKGFDFDTVSGEHRWTLLHQAMEFQNAPMVFALASVVTVFHALDSTGKKAQDMCPFSSPIYKIIRQQSRATFDHNF